MARQPTSALLTFCSGDSVSFLFDLLVYSSIWKALKVDRANQNGRHVKIGKLIRNITDS